jgi:hypothetical protein
MLKTTPGLFVVIGHIASGIGQTVADDGCNNLVNWLNIDRKGVDMTGQLIVLHFEPFGLFRLQASSFKLHSTPVIWTDSAVASVAEVKKQSGNHARPRRTRVLGTVDVARLPDAHRTTAKSIKRLRRRARIDSALQTWRLPLADFQSLQLKLFKRVPL